MVCATGYYSSCYSQCQCSRRRRREASHRSEGPLQNRNSIPQHTTRSQLTAHAKCNNDQLERIMVAAVRASSGDPTVAKASILEGSETLFNGPLAVACGESKLSYSELLIFEFPSAFVFHILSHSSHHRLPLLLGDAAEYELLCLLCSIEEAPGRGGGRGQRI